MPGGARSHPPPQWEQERVGLHGQGDGGVSGMAPGRECTMGGRSRRRQGGRHIPWVRMGDPRVKARGPELGGGVAAAWGLGKRRGAARRALPVMNLRGRRTWGARTCMGLWPGWLAEQWEVPVSRGSGEAREQRPCAGWPLQPGWPCGGQKHGRLVEWRGVPGSCRSGEARGS